VTDTAVRIFTDVVRPCSRSLRCLVRSVPDSGSVTCWSYHGPGMRLALPGVMGYSYRIGLVPV
jgi:hypothetical protein